MERFCYKVLHTLLLTCWLGAGICVSQDKRDCLIQTAVSFEGVREATGKNDGVEVEMFLRTVGFGPGAAWCAAYMAYAYEHCDIPNPKSAWSPNWALDKDAVYKFGEGYKVAHLKAKPGDAFTIYYSSKGRVGHVGMYLYSTVSRVYTIEGNTNQAGSREGDGVYRKVRNWNQVYRITSYVRE